MPTSIVRGYLIALRIPREVFNQALVAYPRMAEVLLELLTRRLLGNLLQSSPLFQEFDARGRASSSRSCSRSGAPRAAWCWPRSGKQMDGLYINLTGSRSPFRRPHARATRAGTMFGQACLLTHEPSDISVVTMSNMLVLRLPAQVFHSIVMQYPGMLAHISDLASNSVAKVTI